MVKNKFILLLFPAALYLSCQSNDCINSLMWTNNNLKSLSLQPKTVRYLGENYCGYSLDINRKWCGSMEMAVRFEDSFLKGDIFQKGDTIFLKSDNGKVSALAFWTPDVPAEYMVNSLVISRKIDDDFKEGYPFEFNYKVSRDTIFNYNSVDMQRIRIINFQRFHSSGLVLVISKHKGIEGIYASTNKGKIVTHDNRKDIDHELIFVSDGNIYLETIPFAQIYDPKTMRMY